ncbi:membrane-spanning 4-domains subfamily A member 15-like [Candoia aspera]|uniref:membrane-spanning 4-domains subfamily A member 15-like n=1 Tax=Candoia aspera TaxID=51853 RepID=UPI002FD80BB7
MASETSNGANLTQTAQGFPSAVVQSPGAIQYGQQLGISNCAPQQVPQKGALEKFVNAQARVLGAVQIMVGLIHIGFGAVSLCLLPSGYVTLSAMGGNPFWGGICFIASGSLCVAAEKRRNHNLVKCSLGMNITSAIMALVGILLYILELAMNTTSLYNSPYKTNFARLRKSQLSFHMSPSLQSVGIGLSSVLFLFYLLEFCITVSFAHFGCQATCCADDQTTMVFVPYQVIGDAATVATEPSPSSSPPTYDNVVTKSQ